MSPLAHLLLAVAVLHIACAASLPSTQSKLIPDLAPETPEGTKDPLDKEATPAVIVDDVENGLRAKPEDIPVQVIVEDSRPAIKSNEVADDDDEIKRPAVDLRNPGPPQRQEHENQNADHFSQAQDKFSIVRDTIVQTQDVLRRGVKGVGEDISNWLSTNEQMNAIQQHIQALRESFTSQIQKLNEAVQGLAAPSASNPEEIPEQVQTKPDLKEVEAKIKILENNFNNGVRALSEGVNIVAILRAEDESTSAAPAKPTPAPAAAAPSPSNPPNVVLQFFSNFQHTLSESVRNVTTALANAVPFLNQATTLNPVVLADSPDGTTPHPANNPWPAWPNLNVFQILGGQGQSQGQDASPNPLWTGITGNPLYQNFVNLINPNAKPSEASTGSNVVPAKPGDEKQTETPVAPAPIAPLPESQPAPAAQPAPIGPIRQILSNNPVVQSIAGTVQRIQSSINNPEKPRDTEKSEDLETKGGHGGNRPGGGDSGDSGLKEIIEEPIKDAITEDTKKPAADKEDTKPEVLEKTE